MGTTGFVISSTETNPTGKFGGTKVLGLYDATVNSDPRIGIANDSQLFTLRIDGADGDKFKIRDGNASIDRIVIDLNGKVGIGTASPRSRLDIGVSLGADKGLRIGDYIEINERENVTNASLIGFNTCIDATDISKFKPTYSGSSISSGMIMTMAGGGLSNIDFYGITWGTDNTPKSLSDFTHVLRLNTNGNVGIGTTAPTYKLDVAGTARTTLSTYLATTAGYSVGIGTSAPLSKLHVQASSGSVELARFFNSDYATGVGSGMRMFTGSSTGNTYSGLQAYTAGTTATGNLILNSAGGNVGIGTTNPGTYKLAVEGIIGAREVKVTIDAWADFVFKPAYKLRSLGEVERFIKANNHLPEIPTEAEVKENGIGLGEMNAKLLQKVEELTLYMIDLQKQIDALKAQKGK